MTTTDSPMTSYHWVITGQTRDGQVGTYDGHLDIHPSHTRMQTYTYLRELLQEQMGTTSIAVLYFDLAPMQFPAVEQ